MASGVVPAHGGDRRPRGRCRRLHAGGGDARRPMRPGLLAGVHGARGEARLRALLRLSRSLSSEHGYPRHRAQPAAALRGLGARRRDELSAHRLLLPETERCARRAEGVLGDEVRRHGLPGRPPHLVDRVRELRLGRAASRLPRRPRSRSCCSSLSWASRRSSRSMYGSPTRWKGPRPCRRSFTRRPWWPRGCSSSCEPTRSSRRLRPRGRSCSLSARRRRCSRPFSRSYRPTSRRSLLIPRARSSGT